MENMRSEILRKRKIASAIFFLSLCPGTFSQAQTLPESVIMMIEEEAEALSESGYEELMARYEYYYEHPVPINRATREELEELGLLNLFQIESLLAHIEQFGDILSAGELSVVDGFNESIVASIMPFISFESEFSIGEVNKKRSVNTEIVIKGKKKWSGNGIGLTSKILTDYSGHSLGITLDNDAGEYLSNCFLPDFSSIHYEYKNKRINLVVGDYTARFGQGLTLWKSFPISFIGAPSSLAKRGKGISGYTSTDEDNYLRGAAISSQIGSGLLSFLLSARNIDARIVDDRYTSIVTGGIHVTDAEKAKRHTMWEYLAGTNYTLKFSTLNLGLTAVAYMYNKHNGRKVSDYNRYQQYDGPWGNVGADFHWFHNHLRYFGEFSVDAHLAPAAIFGVIWNPKYEIETGATFRYYDKSFISTHSGAYSTTSSTSNQIGLAMGLKWLASDRMTINCNSDAVYYPWSRFNVSGSSAMIKGRVSLEYNIDNKFASSLRLNGKIELKTVTTTSFSASAKAKYALSGNFEIDGCSSVNAGGYAAYLGLTFSTYRKRLQLSARVTRYDTADWDSRIYLHEKGMPQTYSVEAFYGKGWSEYLMCSFSAGRRFKIYLKASNRYCAFFTRITIPG